MQKQLQGYMYLALAMVTVGSTVVASKFIGAGLPPFTATAIRFAIAAPILWLLVRGTGTAWPRPGRHDAILLLLQAGAGSVGYTSLLIVGLRYSPVADAGVILGTLPMVSAAIAMLVLGDRPGRGVLLAIALASIGVLFIALQPGVGSTRAWRGNALVLGAVVCEGFFILLNKRLRTPLAPLVLSAVMAGLGCVVAAVAAVLLEQPWTLPLPGAAMWAVLYYALVPTVAGFLLWYAGSARVSGAEAALFTAVAPVSAVLMAVLLLGEALTGRQALGMGCVLLAVAIAGLSQRRPAARIQTVAPD